MKKCVILEMENKVDFENKMNENIYPKVIKLNPVHAIASIIKLF